MSNNIFRIFNPKAPKEDPVERRRAQLRRAQQSYRSRRDRYTKSLENDVATSRANEVQLMREIGTLRDSVHMLTNLLAQYDIAIPGADFHSNGVYSSPESGGAGGGFDSSPFGDLTNGLDFNNGNSHSSPGDSFGGGHQTLSNGSKSNPTSSSAVFSWQNGNSPLNGMQQQSPPPSNNNAQPLSHQHSHSHSHSHSPLQQLDLLPQTDVARIPRGPQDERARVCELNQTTVGMEFVLTIETPCLSHLHGDPKTPHDPNGHSLTTSAQLYSAITQDSSSPPSSSSSPPSTYYQDAPAALLNRLLSLAPELAADGEATPIQAWNYIQSQPHFRSLSLRSVKTLAERLRDAVKCHGFGAVVGTAALEKLVSQTMFLGNTG